MIKAQNGARSHALNHSSSSTVEPVDELIPLLYGLVHNSEDAISLQSDLGKLVEWAKLWQMAFNPSKCYVLRFCRLNQVSFYTPTHYAWPYPARCRPLSLPRSFSVRKPKLEATSSTLQTKPIRHLALSRGTCIIAHRRLKIRPTNR